MNIGKFKIKHLYYAIALLVFAFAVFFPFRSVATDEHDYFANAGNIIHNTLRMTCDFANSPTQFPVADYCIFKYNLGTSLFFIPAAYIGQSFAFITTLAVFIIAIFIFSKLLEHYKLPAKYIYLFAFYPPFVYYSRTLYSEIFSMMLMLAGSYFLLTNTRAKHLVLAGLFLGFTVYVRYTNVIPVAILCLALTFQKNYKLYFQKLLMIGLGALPFAILFLATNNYIYGAPLRSGYYFSGEEDLRMWSMVPKYAPIYLGITLLMYPGMLLSLKAIKEKILRYAVLACLVIMSVFYATFPGGNNVFEGRLLDLILGMRYLLPLIPYLILAYAKSWDTHSETKTEKLAYIIFVAGLICGVFAISYLHWDFLKSVTS